MNFARRLLGISLVLLAGLGSGASAQPIDPSSYADMRWRLVGPFRGGWATCAAGVPDDPAVYYFGAAAGGVWKTEDAGLDLGARSSIARARRRWARSRLRRRTRR